MIDSRERYINKFQMLAGADYLSPQRHIGYDDHISLAGTFYLYLYVQIPGISVKSMPGLNQRTGIFTQSFRRNAE